MRFVPALILSALVMGLLIFLDVARPLGAHPWWSQKTLLIGAPIGLALATLASRYATPLLWLILFAALAALTFGLARNGQSAFAASYAEDALAGRMWYFGWVATGAALAGGVMTLTAALLPARKG